MSSLHLQIVTPDGLIFDGEAESVSVRACTGNVTILPHHMNYVTPLGMGEAHITVNGVMRRAACIGGMLAVKDETVRVIATTFEWQEKIDLERAKLAMEKARQKLAGEQLSKEENMLAEAKLRRALVRTSVAMKK